jgi:hypothetical protein
MFDLTLTFDNGPEPETTPFVLDVLARRSLRTTFFVVGHKLSTLEGRRLARRAHEEGHWIGNHTWSHSTTSPIIITGISRRVSMAEVKFQRNNPRWVVPKRWESDCCILWSGRF